MVAYDQTSDKPMAARQPTREDIRVTQLMFDRRFWPFDMPFIQDVGHHIATVAACCVPAEFAALDGIVEMQCVITHEPLILLGYLFRTGLFLDPADARVLIGKEF
jgi:hypothetical protein